MKYQHARTGTTWYIHRTERLCRHRLIGAAQRCAKQYAARERKRGPVVVRDHPAETQEG